MGSSVADMRFAAYIRCVSSVTTHYHHGSHRNLLWSADGSSSAPSKVDAIIVPTARHPVYLAEAANLAQTLGSSLVTLHSRQWTSAAKTAQRLPRSVDLIAIDVPDPADLRLPDWHTSRLLAGTVFGRRTDLSAKRNLSLMLSHLLGWSRVLFLDDDITQLNPDHVRRASGALDTHNAAGLYIAGFPDHSVVCHAYLQAGGSQQSFISGKALAVQVNRSTSFFPDIYNDDWFFLLDDGDKGLQSVAVAGEVRQYPYDPFRFPERARDQELGDVLSEGIYWLLDDGGSIADADRAHWSRFLSMRRLFIGQLLQMVEKDNTIERTDKARRIAALKIARGSLSLITPELCENYLRAWAADRQVWYRHLQKLPTQHIHQLPVDELRPYALATLSRPRAPRLKWQLGPRGNPHRPHAAHSA